MMKRHVTVVTQRLLFLLPPSCMVAPIGKSANKYSFLFFNNTTTASNFQNTLLTMPSEINIGMDLQSGQVLTNNSEVQEKNPLTSANFSRDPSMVSSGRSTPYHDRMDTDPDIETTTGENDNEHFELSYETEQDKTMRIGKTTIQQDNMRPLATNNEANPPHGIHEDDIINI